MCVIKGDMLKRHELTAVVSGYGAALTMQLIVEEVALVPAACPKYLESTTCSQVTPQKPDLSLQRELICHMLHET